MWITNGGKIADSHNISFIIFLSASDLEFCYYTSRFSIFMANQQCYLLCCRFKFEYFVFVSGS